jgi:hypothetical protein
MDLERLERWREKAEKLVRHMESSCVGEAKAATAEDLTDYLGLSNDRDLRLVRDCALYVLRVPIVSTFDGGYCIASGYDDDGYAHCINQRREVARSNFDAVRAINEAMEERYGPPRLFEVAS